MEKKSSFVLILTFVVLLSGCQTRKEKVLSEIRRAEAQREVVQGRLDFHRRRLDSLNSQILERGRETETANGKILTALSNHRVATVCSVALGLRGSGLMPMVIARLTSMIVIACGVAYVVSDDVNSEMKALTHSLEEINGELLNLEARIDALRVEVASVDSMLKTEQSNLNLLDQNLNKLKSELKRL